MDNFVNLAISELKVPSCGEEEEVEVVSLGTVSYRPFPPLDIFNRNSVETFPRYKTVLSSARPNSTIEVSISYILQAVDEMGSKVTFPQKPNRFTKQPGV